MDNTGEDHPLNKLRVVIEPGLWRVPVLPQPARGSGGKRGAVLRGEALLLGCFMACNKTSAGGGTRARRWLQERCDRLAPSTESRNLGAREGCFVLQMGR